MYTNRLYTKWESISMYLYTINKRKSTTQKKKKKLYIYTSYTNNTPQLSIVASKNDNSGSVSSAVEKKNSTKKN